MQVIFNSELNRRNALTHGVPLHNVTVIHSGVDIHDFWFAPRYELHYPLSIVVPGRIERRKGQLDAVRLLEHLLTMNISADLTIVGEKWEQAYVEEVEDEVRRYHLEDRVRLLPMLSQQELVKLYSHADFCLFSSQFRTGFSRIPLEAMACGCLTITYGNEGSDEVICHGKTGFIVAPTDHASVVALLRDLLASPQSYRAVIHAARRVIEESYSMEQYIDRIEQVIQNTAEHL
jgi:glycosyltransferase involved in cell wall biosynthesis